MGMRTRETTDNYDGSRQTPLALWGSRETTGDNEIAVETKDANRRQREIIGAQGRQWKTIGDHCWWDSAGRLAYDYFPGARVYDSSWLIGNSY